MEWDERRQIIPMQAVLFLQIVRRDNDEVFFRQIVSHSWLPWDSCTVVQI